MSQSQQAAQAQAQQSQLTSQSQPASQTGSMSPTDRATPAGLGHPASPGYPTGPGHHPGLGHQARPAHPTGSGPQPMRASQAGTGSPVGIGQRAKSMPAVSSLPPPDLPPGLVPLLPHRVPAPPDVPDVPDDDDDYDTDLDQSPQPGVDGLGRVLDRLRDDEEPVEPPADLDVTAVLEAVRHVPGVANAQLRGNPGGMHTLRLDLADGADPGLVSRQVARLLKQRMGLAAEPRRARPATPEPPAAAPPAAARPPLPRPRPATLSDVAARADAMNRGDSAGRTEAPISDMRMAEAQPRVTVDQVRVSTLGTEATVEVRLMCDDVPSVGAASGPAVDGYLLRLAAQAAASAIDGLVEASPDAPNVRCFIDHAGVVPFGSVAVAVVVVLVTGAGWVEQLVGSALVGGDPRQAIVRATLAAVNRRLESLLA